MRSTIVALIALSLCNITSADNNDEHNSVVSFDKQSSTGDLYRRIQGLVAENHWETVEVRVFVKFADYASAQNGCSWARAQKHRVFTGYTVGRRDWDCVIELVTNEFDVAGLEEMAQVIVELDSVYGGSASNWLVGGRAPLAADANDA